MKNIEDYIKTILVPGQEYMQPALNELNRVGINGFSYSRIYKNGKFITLSTNIAWAKHHFQEFFATKYKPSDIKTTELLNGPMLWISNPANEVWRSAQAFGLGNGLLLTENQANYKEVYCYTADPNNHQIHTFYLSHFDFLKQVNFLLKDKAMKIIQQASASPLDTPELYQQEKSALSSKTSAQTDSFALPKPKRFYLNDRTYLTLKEAACLAWCVQGKSAGEIAIILGSSKRTIESHLEKLKLKLGCYKQTDLVRIALQLGILNFNW